MSWQTNSEKRELVVRNVPGKTEPVHLTWHAIDHSPDRRYAVVQLKPDTFLGIIPDEEQGGELTGTYVDTLILEPKDELGGTMYSVNWARLNWGYARIREFCAETGTSRVAARIYFDTELYRQEYEKLNGTPCLKRRFRHEPGI